MSLAPRSWLPGPSDRVIEVAPPDLGMFEFLRANGCTRYLGLVVQGCGLPRSSLPAADAMRFVPMQSIDEIRNHNADVLVLHGAFGRFLWHRDLGRARVVAVRAGRAGAAEVRLAGRLHKRPPPTRVTWGGCNYDLVEMPGGDRVRARRYASQIGGPDALPRLLKAHDVDYVVLGSLGTLPVVGNGQVPDVLVADDDVETFCEVVEHEPGTVPVDVYSASGRPGSDYQNMAYFPPAVAAAVLQRSIRQARGYSVPSGPDLFAALAYRAVYHQGVSSGLPTARSARSSGLVADGHRVLTELAALNGVDGPPTLERLDDHLAEIGWRPPLDMLARLSRRNAWIRQRFFADAADQVDPPALSVFLLRDRASDANAVALAAEVLTRHGFEILSMRRLDAAARARCARDIRGGNWAAGPFPASGGEPAVVVVGIDDQPTGPAASADGRHAGLTNSRTRDAKVEFRQRVWTGLGPAMRFNPMHSSDSEEDAWRYLGLADPTVVYEIRAIVEARRRAHRAADRQAVRRTPSVGARAAPRDRRPAWCRRVTSTMTHFVLTARRAGSAVVRWGVSRRVSSVGPRHLRSTEARGR